MRAELFSRVNESFSRQTVVILQENPGGGGNFEVTSSTNARRPAPN